MNSKNLLQFTLQCADTALIHGHRLSEWTGHGPILEQDIALTNTSLDHLGAARSLYQYAAEQYNALSKEDRENIFTSPALARELSEGQAADEDDLAYLRDSWDFHNLLLVELPNRDWAYTIAKSFLFDSFNFFYQSALVNSKDERLAAVAEKSLKEVTYHLRWSSEWLIRLGDGTDESHDRIQHAVNDTWAYTGECFKQTEAELQLVTSAIVPDVSLFKDQWLEKVKNVFAEATLELPKTAWMQEGGKQGIHTEHLGYILAEMQHMQRTYPGMEW